MNEYKCKCNYKRIKKHDVVSFNKEMVIIGKTAVAEEEENTSGCTVT